MNEIKDEFSALDRFPPLESDDKTEVIKREQKSDPEIVKGIKDTEVTRQRLAIIAANEAQTLNTNPRDSEGHTNNQSQSEAEFFERMGVDRETQALINEAAASKRYPTAEVIGQATVNKVDQNKNPGNELEDAA